MSIINFITSLIATFKKLGLIKDVDTYFGGKNIDCFITNSFNGIFICLFIGGLTLYLLINLIKYFKGKEKSKKINFVLILTFISLIIDGLVLVAINSPDDSMITSIMEKLTFNLTGEKAVLLVLGYFTITFVGSTTFLGLFCGKKC